MWNNFTIFRNCVRIAYHQRYQIYYENREELHWYNFKLSFPNFNWTAKLMKYILMPNIYFYHYCCVLTGDDWYELPSGIHDVNQTWTIKHKQVPYQERLFLLISLYNYHLNAAVKMNRNHAIEMSWWNIDIRQATGVHGDWWSGTLISNATAWNHVTVDTSRHARLQSLCHVNIELTVEGNKTAWTSRECNHVVTVVPPISDSSWSNRASELNLIKSKNVKTKKIHQSLNLPCWQFVSIDVHR